MIRAGIRRLFFIARWSRPRYDVDEEIRAHFALRIAELRAEGMSAEDAEAEALRRFGPLEAGRERLYAAASERNRTLRLRDRMDALRLDLAQTVRRLARSPAFTFGIVLTLAIGVGVNSAVFRILDRVLFRPPAGVHHPDAMHFVLVTREGGRGSLVITSVSYPQFRALSDVSAFAHLAAFTAPRVDTLADKSTLVVSTIGAGFMELVGVKPWLGRFFTADELRPLSGISSIVLSHDAWQRVFGGASRMVGQSIALNGRSYQVVGVAPAGFRGVDANPVDAWIPLGAGRFGRGFSNGTEIPWTEIRMAFPLRVVARLHPSVAASEAIAQAQSRLEEDQALGGGAAARLRVDLPTYRELQRFGQSASSIEVLTRVSIVAALLLLLTCVNATNLMLLRGARRRREIAVRLALGISRRRLAAQVVMETLVVSTLAAAAAALTGFWAATALRRLLFPAATWVDHSADARSLGFTVAIAFGVAIAVSLLPILQSGRTDIALAMKDGAPRRSRRRVRELLVVAQAGLSMMLLVGTGLFVRSLHQLSKVDLGMDPVGLVSFHFERLSAAVPGASSFQTVGEVERAISGAPGVVATTVATLPPFGASRAVSVAVPGVSEITGPGEPTPIITGVRPEYFAVMGMRVVEGRPFTEADDLDGPRVVIVNRALARRAWPGESAVGKCFKVGGSDAPCSRVVGVVETLRDDPRSSLPMLRYYVPAHQSAMAGEQTTVIARADPVTAAALARRVGSSTTLRGMRAAADVIETRVAAHMRMWRTGAALFGALGFLALLLGGIGLASVLLVVVNERSREIGLRLAVGATPGAVARSVVRHGLRLAVVGVSIGAVLSVGGARSMAAVVFGISVFDVPVYLAGAVALAVVAIVAASIPAVRAARVDPVVALRQE